MEAKMEIADSSAWPTMRTFLPPWRRKGIEVGSLMATGSPT